MNADFHYYATYCACLIAGYKNEEARRIAYSANFVDCCTKTILAKCKAPISAATTQSQIELADADSDIIGLQDMTRIWASFHFLPGDLYAPINHGSKRYKNKYRLICKPNSQLLIDTILLAKDKDLEAIGIAMHVLADTWAHQYFAGTPSLVINNAPDSFNEIIDDKKYPIHFSHNVSKPDNIIERRYINSIYRPRESNIMNLGHGRAGHLPDLSFIKYEYMPSYGNYDLIIKDNPNDFYHAFTQMVYTLKFYRGKEENFELNKYDKCEKYSAKVKEIINKRQLDSTKEWKEFASELAKEEILDFDSKSYENEYLNADKNNKEKTNFNNFVIHALRQKSMVTNRIYKSKNKLAGYSIEYNGKGLRGLRDYWKLLEHTIKGDKDV